MIYLVTNITDSSPAPTKVSIGDIGNARSVIEVAPGQTIDLEKLFTRNQICESKHLKSWVNQGLIVIDTLGTEPDEDCRLWVNAKVTGITIDNVNITEPIEISVDVGGVESPVSGTIIDGKTYINNKEYNGTPLHYNGIAGISYSTITFAKTTTAILIDNMLTNSTNILLHISFDNGINYFEMVRGSRLEIETEITSFKIKSNVSNAKYQIVITG